VFDTAVALMALNLIRRARLAEAARGVDLDSAIHEGRSFLLSVQEPDGHWPETTRPSNQESYAQRISTTGWALMALIDTR